MSIDFNGLISGVDGAVPVELLTQRQGGVDAIVFLIFMVAHRGVVQEAILEKTIIKNSWTVIIKHNFMKESKSDPMTASLAS